MAHQQDLNKVMPKFKSDKSSNEKSISGETTSRLEKAVNIGDFLSLWLTDKLLDPQAQKVFDQYYWSYRRHFGRRIRWAYSQQVKEAIDIIRSRPDIRVLEIGFGLGTESLWFSMLGAKVLAIDILGEFQRAANQRKKILERHIKRTLCCEFRCTSVMDLDEEESYDLIWMEQAFHHLEPRDAVIGKIVSLTKPGGHIVVSEVNALNLLIQLQLFLARGRNMYFTHVDEDGKEILIGRERIITAYKLRKIFEKLNVKCNSVRYYRLFPNQPLFEKFWWLEKLLARNWLALLQTHYNYVGKKKE